MEGTAEKTSIWLALRNPVFRRLWLANTLAPGQAEAIEPLLVIATQQEADDANQGPSS